MGKARIAVVSMEPVRSGSAAMQHLDAIQEALERRYSKKFDILRIQPKVIKAGRSRILQLVVDQFRIVLKVARCRAIYMRWHPLSLPAIGAARLLGTPVALEVNGTSEDMFLAHPKFSAFTPIVNLAVRVEFKLAQQIVTVTPGLAKWTSERGGGNRVVVLTNGASVALGKRRSPPADPPTVVFFGELASWQGLDTVIDAKAHSQWPTGVHLQVIGTGAMQDAVNLAAESDATFKYLGKLPQSEAHHYVAKAIATISTQSGTVARNRFGVAPLKVAESIMLGVPAIISNIGGHSDVLSQEGYEWIIPPDDPRALVDAISRVAETNVDRDSIAEIGRRVLAWESVGEKTADIMGGILHLSE